MVGWVSTVEKGRFAHLVLPPNLDGRGLLEMSLVNFTELFALREREARGEGEGSAWVVSAEETSALRGIALGLFNAIRREESLYSSR
ncbi:hypothetical protein EON64_15695 [archaeon]|nr:MAG: hypothetical protein EON64_15695 [archaeon]